jgi:site-specific recombinase XerD
MVKKDLERVGIAYETEEGIADFHAAGRHTHITELLRNGASLPEAKELARHSDVSMTMRYTHIGLNDQAKAVAVAQRFKIVMCAALQSTFGFVVISFIA